MRYLKPSLFFLAAASVWIGAATTQLRPIDRAHSSITVRVFKAGLFSAFGHNHEITGSIDNGTVDAATRQVELRVHGANLQVSDPHASAKDRAEIQSTMLGSSVLNVKLYPEITFQSARAESSGAGRWKLYGNLTLHGETRPVIVDVRETSGHYIGEATLKQTDFGIKPVAVAGGSIRVKDEVRVEFDVQLAH